MKTKKLGMTLAGTLVLIAFLTVSLSACCNPFRSPNWECTTSHTLGGRIYTGEGVDSSEEKAKQKALDDWEAACIGDHSSGCEKEKKIAYVSCEEV